MPQMMLVLNEHQRSFDVCGTSERVLTFLFLPNWRECERVQRQTFEDQLVGRPFAEALKPAY